jgi:transketolase
MEMIGINDTFGESGQPDELMKKFGLTAENIAQKTTQLLKRKKITNS